MEEYITELRIPTQFYCNDPDIRGVAVVVRSAVNQSKQEFFFPKRLSQEYKVPRKFLMDRTGSLEIDG